MEKNQSAVSQIQHIIQLVHNRILFLLPTVYFCHNAFLQVLPQGRSTSLADGFRADSFNTQFKVLPRLCKLKHILDKAIMTLICFSPVLVCALCWCWARPAVGLTWMMAGKGSCASEPGGVILVRVWTLTAHFNFIQFFCKSIF